MNEMYNGEPLTLLFAEEGRGTYAVVVEEGTGDNLWDEDVDNGYVDYINWEMYAVRMDYNLPTFVEWDGGMVLMKNYAQETPVEVICDIIRNETGMTSSPHIVESV